MTKQHKQKKYLYQLWPAMNRFYLNGCIITGPKSDFPISIGPYIFLTLIITLYSYFILIDMLKQNLILSIAFLISFLATITFMLFTSYSDPAIIPMRPFLMLKQQQLEFQYQQDYQELLKDKQYQQLQYLLYQTSDPHQVFCQTCHIYRPQSTSHCRQCDNCILQIDHHCPWLNTCIGKNNYKWFILFICSLVVMMLAFCCNVIVWMGEVVGGGKGDNGKEDKNNNNILNVYVIMCLIIVGALIVVIVGFCLFHLFLMIKGKTTRQFIKDINKKQYQQRKIKISNNKISIDKQSSFTKQQQDIRESLIIDDKIKLPQPTINKQNQSQQQNSITNSNHNNNNTNIIHPNNKDRLQHRLLDNYIQSHYRQTKIFYKQLFKTNQNIYFVNFNKKLQQQQQQQFIIKGMQQLRKKQKQQKENGKFTVYYKQL